MSFIDPPFQTSDVEAAFAAFPEIVRPKLLALRRLIFETAMETAGVGQVAESLKWGEPSYVPLRPRTGTAIRLGVPKGQGYALYTHCQTSVIDDFRSLFPHEFKYIGNRAVVFGEDQDPDLPPLRLFVVSALTYRLTPTSSAGFKQVVSS